MAGDIVSPVNQHTPTSYKHPVLVKQQYNVTVKVTAAHLSTLPYFSGG
jgi:hypothetical protein